MTLLAPAALIGLLLLALPVIVHLLRPRKMKQTPFSSLRWLKLTRQRLSRRIQWHQWLLFLLRAGLIVLLVAALARPILGLMNSAGPVDRFLIVDAGRGMGYETKDGPTPLERARDLAARLAEQAAPGDRTAILLAGGPVKLAAPLSSDPAAHLAKLRAAPVQATEASVSAALSILPALLGPEPERDVELVFLTSNQRSGWRPDEIQAFTELYGKRTRVEVIDVGTGGSNAWIANARLFERGPNEDRVLRVEVGCVGESGQERSVRLTGIDGLGDDARSIALQPGRITRADFAIPPSVALAGQVAELRLEPADALPSDDRWFVNLGAPWALRLLLVEPGKDADANGTGLYLRTALDALTTSGNHAIRLTGRSAGGVTGADVEAADVVVLAGVAKLSDDALTNLERRVRAGAGLVIFLGPQMDESFYREKLYRSLQPDDGLLPVAVKAGAAAFRQGAVAELRQVRWLHPLLAPLRDPLVGDLGLCRFQKYALFDAAPGKADTVLARFDDDTPALIERPLGAGRVLLWNTTADDAWSDLPRRRSFVPVVDRTLGYLAAGGVRKQFVVGEPINLPVASDGATMTAPDGTKAVARVVRTGTQKVLHLDDVTQAGVYRVTQLDGKGWAFAVNAGRDASPLTPMDTEALQAWWSPAAFELVGGDAALARLETQAGAWPLWPALIVLAGLLLLAETVYVYRLCPRGNPAVVESVVPQRGILKPVGNKAN